MSNIITNGIDNKNREERRRRAIDRRNEDIARGFTRANVPMRGDYKLCREADKVLKDYRRFKDPNDRIKIKAEYEGRQREYRKFRK